MDNGLQTTKLSELPEAITLNESDYSLIVQNGTSKKIKGLLLKGNAGDNGKSIEIQKTDTHIQWRQEGGQWINLVALADLKGDKGEQGGGANVDLTDYATKVWVTQQLASYYTKAEIDSSLSNKADISHAHTEYASIDHVHNYNDLTNKPTIPTKTSDLTNDSGFLTSIPSEYVTEEEMSTALSNKANKSDIPSLDGYATENFVTTKIAEASLSGEGITTEPLNDDIPRIFLSEGTLPTTKDSTTMKIEYKSKTKTFSGYVDIKCQGTSSMSYPKKNFTIKLYKDKTKTVKMTQNFRDWGNQSKFCLKANWIDASHARNIVSAKLWGDCVKSRENFEELPIELKTSPNYGAIDGFFVKVYSNGVYQGRYTMNIPKDAWMCNMDKVLDTHCILCGEEYSSGCFQTVNANLWSDELHDTMPTSIAASFENAQRFVINSSDEEFKSNLSNYFDVNSLIDYYCFHYAVCGLDGLGKNQLFLTYDGVHWIASSYDMDSTFGLYWNGTSFVSASYRMQEDYESMTNGRLGNKLYLRLEKAYAEEINARYSQLREGALSVSNIINRFEDFMICNTDLINEDFTIFPDIPSQKTNNIQQIRQYAVNRLMYVDNCINNSVIYEEQINNLLSSADYKLTESFTFNGTSDFIDTNIKLFDTIKDFSIYIDYVTPFNVIDKASIFHAMNEVTPYPGINLQVENVYRVSGDGWRIEVHPVSPNVRRKIVLTYTQSTNKLVLYHDNDSSDYSSVSGIIATPTFRVIEQTALLGCYQTSTGDKGRFWSGIINKCGIWLDKVLTSDEIGALTNNVYGNIVLSKTSITMNEGTSDTFTVKLDKAPTNSQTVNISSDNNDVTLSANTLTFNSSNYSTEQTVTINVAEDSDKTNDNCTITLSSSGVTNKTVVLTINDITVDDTPSEAGGYVTDESKNRLMAEDGSYLIID